MGSEGTTKTDEMALEEYYNYFNHKVETTMVKPSAVTDHPAMTAPSHLDHLHMDRYVPLLFLYRLADNSDPVYNQYVANLKDSLAKTVVSFYPAAGAIVKTSNPSHPRMFLCDDRGVPFTEAYKDAAMNDVVNPDAFSPAPPLQGWEPAGLMSHKQCQLLGDSGSPGIVIQVTRFRCGGVALCMSWNHLLADMTGAMLILRAWADIASTGHTTIVPQLDRTLLEPRQEVEDSEPTAPPQMSDEEKAKLQAVLNTKFTLKVFRFKREKIAKLKQQAVQDVSDLSTMDCVSAHLWRCLSRYYANFGITDKTIFSTAVEGRKRMPGTLTPHFFGNVIVPAFVRNVPTSKILAKPLSYAAGLIRQAHQAVNQETYWTIIDQMDLANPWKTSINRTDHQLGLTSWIRFGMYDLDFSQGNPVYSMINMFAQISRKGQCICIPSRPGDGYCDVLLYLTPHALKHLSADPEFTSLT
ncbi:hypothetical protein Mapa_010668 [Marchantia paleacea]|nr:hypothetical protein Mapa_010668 [Marchantia paleacea]